MSKLTVVLLALCLSCAMLAVACSDGKTGPAHTPPPAPPVIPPLTLATSALPLATVETPFETSLNFSAAATCKITSGALPPGVAMDTAGNIAGTPRITGDWVFTVTGTDGQTTIVQTLTLKVEGVRGNDTIDRDLRTLGSTERMLMLLPHDVPKQDAARVQLGRLLFFDKELSGNRDVACASCHHPSVGYGDALSFSVGVGSNGMLGEKRRHPHGKLIPRNSPPIYNVGLYPSMFWDKRVRMPLNSIGQLQPTRSPVVTPEGVWDLEPDEAQALFPIADLDEMRGTGHELDGLDNTSYREALVARLRKFPEYVTLFEQAFGQDGMTVQNMGRAIASFERSQTFVNSPWDRYQLGEREALTDSQKRGAILFFGRATCGNCHSGPLLTDFEVRNVIVPQFGPGRGEGAATGEDYGAAEVTGQRALRFTFRTPTLRNISLTAPYMHNGAFNTLREVVMHYRDKGDSTRRFKIDGLVQAPDLKQPAGPNTEMLRRQTNLINRVPRNLTDAEIDDIVAFLETLTDPAAVNRMNEVPESVPSGLPVDR